MGDSHEEQLERILQLASVARRLEGKIGKRHFAVAAEAHGEACENLWEELYRQLDERDEDGSPVVRRRMALDPRKELKKQIVARLQEELPSMVASVIDEF